MKTNIFTFLLLLAFFGLSAQALKDSKREAQSQRTIKLGTSHATSAPKKEVSVIMNDPLMNKKWDLEKISAEQAWLKFSKGSRDIVVAVIDTGIDTNHPDLADNMWKNSKEIPGNGKDDDGNGYVDDIYGWNFVANNNKVNDTHGHGTHIAGIIGAVGGNNIGLSGVSPKVSLMALKYYNPNDNGKQNLKNTVKAINYAVQNGAHIINYSGGGLEPNLKEKEAIRKAQEKGILFVAASGNEGSNIDKKTSYYPARYPFNNILPVTATDTSDQVLNSSNYGKTVHESAPGRNILSTLPRGRYGHMTGTSQATAVATGAAALIMAYYKNKTAVFTIKHLKMTGDIKHQLKGKTSQRRRLNIFKALQARGKTVNFMDIAVADPQCGDDYLVRETDQDGNPLPSPKSDPACAPKLLQVQKEVEMLGKISKISSIGATQRQTAGVKSDRELSSAEKKPSFLKRWFWNKKSRVEENQK